MSSPAVNLETGEAVVQGGRSPRFTLWFAFLVFSCITLGSAVEVRNSLEESSSAANWAVTGSAITFAVTFVLVACHLLPLASTLVVGTRVEGLVILILACFWAAIVSIVTNASNGLGVSNDTTNQVQNGNLYYFSWAGFFTSVILMVSYLKSAFGLDVASYSNRAARLSLWGGLLASSLIVMGSSVRLFTGNSCSGSEEMYCRRTKFGLSLGVIGVAFSILIVALKLLTPYLPVFAIEFATAVVLTICNGFGVAYITSPKGPGSPIGNMYYSMWLSFFYSAFLLAGCWEQRGASNAAAASSSNEQKPDVTEVTVEDLEDNI